MRKYEFKELPELILTLCNSFPSKDILDERDDEMKDKIFQSYAEIIFNLSDPAHINLLINFWKNNVPENISPQTKAITYECLYIIYSSFESTSNAFGLLNALDKFSDNNI